MFQFIDKSYYRQKTNELASKENLSGVVVDLGGGRRSSYLKHFNIDRKTKIISVNSSKTDKPIIFADLEKNVPLADGYADFVLAFNIFEHIFDQPNLLKEVKRVLKNNSVFFAATPFLKEIHPDPRDYYRLSPSAWAELLKRAGFKKIKISTISAGPMIACYTLLQTVAPKVILVIIYPIFWIIDWLLLKSRPAWKDVFILGIFIKAFK